MAILLLICIPIIATLLSLLPKKQEKIIEGIAAFAGACELVLTIFIIRDVALSGPLQMTKYFSIDALGALVLLTVVIVACAALFYSIGYLREEIKKDVIGLSRLRQFYVLIHLFVGAMIYSVAATSPILMWISLETTTITTIFLISFYNKPSSTEAAWKYLIINTIGLLLGFFGTLLFFTAVVGQGSSLTTWQSLAASAPLLNPMIAKMAFIFVLIGYGTKMGLAPMHTWLPDAHSKAPPPVSALLSGALLNVALLAIMRFKGITDSVAGLDFTQNLLIGFGMISLAIAAFIIMVQKKYKRLFAYSSIEHMGIIAIGLGFGGFASFAALLHMLYHSMIKSILFFSAGNIFLKYGTTSIDKIRGLSKTLPTTAGILFIAFLAITGVPPFGMFMTELTILTAGFSAHMPIAIVMLVLLTLVFVGFFRHVVSMMYGAAPQEIQPGETRWWFMTLPLIVMTIALVSMSVYVPTTIRSLITAAISIIS